MPPEAAVLSGRPVAAYAGVRLDRGPSRSHRDSMPVTTLDIDAPVLAELQRLQREERMPLDRLVSELLAQAIRQRGSAQTTAVQALRWHTAQGGFQIDPADKEALQRALDDERART